MDKSKMNPIVSYPDTFIGEVSDVDLGVAFNKSFQYWTEKAKKLTPTAEQPGVKHLKNVWPLSSANPCDAKDFHKTFVKKSDEVTRIMSWFNARRSQIDFHKVCAEKNTRGEVVNASHKGHAMAIEFRKVFCTDTVLKGAKEVRVTPSRIELVKALWNEINETKKTGVNVDYSQKGSLVQTLKEHKMMTGDFKTLPELCFQKNKKGEYYMSKFLAGSNKTSLFSVEEIDQMISSLKDHPDGTTIIKAVEDVKLSDDKDRTFTPQLPEIKKNSMTMDYGFMFWLVMYLGDFTVSQVCELLLNCYNINLNSTSDRKCKKYIDGRYEGFKDRAGKVPKNETFGKLKNILIEFKGTEKVLQDNPFFVTDKVILEVLKIAGAFPMIYNKSKIFGFHELFCIKNLIRLDINKKVVDNFMKELEKDDKSKGHIIHRGLIGSLFCNISQIDSDLVTFSIKG
jgi:hypothetical protein